jgi:nitrogenase iron protein NifH
MGTTGIKRIAIYGRNGVGKTTISANLSVALARAGLRVLLVGCGCKADSVISTRGNGSVPTLLGLMRERPAASLEEVVQEGFAGVFRLETGAPQSGGTHLDTSIMTAVQHINESGLFERLGLDYVIYNVQGDEAGGGFTVPIRKGLFQDIFTVMSAELKSVRAANSLFELIRQHSGDGGARAGGIIANFMDAPYSRELIDGFAEKTATKVLAYLPRSFRLSNTEAGERTIFEASPDSPLINEFDSLALKITNHGDSLVPRPLVPDDVWRFSMTWNTRFAEMEAAEGAGAGI